MVVWSLTLPSGLCREVHRFCEKTPQDTSSVYSSKAAECDAIIIALSEKLKDHWIPPGRWADGWGGDEDEQLDVPETMAVRR